jgi:type II secretory pathway component PulL
MDDINLLYQNVVVKQTNKTLLTTWIIAGCIVGLFVVSMVGVYAITFTLNATIANLNNQQDQLISSLLPYKNRFYSLQLIDDRLRGIAKIINNRQNYDKIMGVLLSAAPVTVSFPNFTISKKTVTLSATAPTLSDLNTYLANLQSLVSHKKIIRSVNQDGLTADNNQGQFKMDLTLTLL